MNPLLETTTFLVDQMTSDPVLNLVQAVAWLDPSWLDDEDPDDFDDPMNMALRVTRQAVPDIYSEAVQRLQAGESYSGIESLICTAVSAKGIPLHTLEYIDYGIPMDAYGVELDCPDFYAQHPDLLPVLALFGVHPDPDHYRIAVPEAGYRAGPAIALSLDDHAHPGYRDLGYLMQWLWSCSGNSAIDWSYEMVCEVPPMSWGTEEVAFAIEIIREAEDILAGARRGIQFLQAHPPVMAALERNIKRLYRAIHKQGDPRKELRLRLEWPQCPPLEKRKTA